MTARKCEGRGRALRRSLGPLGPKCARKRAQSSPDGRTASQGPGVPPSLSRRLTAPVLHPGQTEIPLVDHQPTLWSI